jgi:hypothetical protein
VHDIERDRRVAALRDDANPAYVVAPEYAHRRVGVA